MTTEKNHTPSNIDTTPSHEDFEYKLLQGHYRTDGSYKTTEQLQMEYLNLTDKLIHTITDGVDVVDRETGERMKKTPDTLIFLDKSARPVSWLLKEMWPKFAVDEDGNVPEMPKIRYLNIDREQWVNSVDPEGTGMMDINKIDQSVIRSLRSIFVSPRQKTDGLTAGIDEAPSELDDETVLIVDEVISSGRTLDIACKFIERAFPNAKVAGTHWMGGLATRNGGMSVGNADLPVWYKEDNELGRGVGNRPRDPSDYHSDNLTQRLGRWFLSTRLRVPDEDAMQLRRELTQLAHNPDVPIQPSMYRDDYEERVERLNDTSFEVAQAAINKVRTQK